MPIEVQLLLLDEFVGNLNELTLLALIQLFPRLAVVFCFDANYLLSRIMQPASAPSYQVNFKECSEHPYQLLVVHLSAT